MLIIFDDIVTWAQKYLVEGSSLFGSCLIDFDGPIHDFGSDHIPYCSKHGPAFTQVWIVHTDGLRSNIFNFIVGKLS